MAPAIRSEPGRLCASLALRLRRAETLPGLSGSPARRNYGPVPGEFGDDKAFDRLAGAASADEGILSRPRAFSRARGPPGDRGDLYHGAAEQGCADGGPDRP